jgi:5-methyltetrahydropteroyltriglutamate--homocysteine methyltransferase
LKKLIDVVGIPLAVTQVGKYPRPSWYDYDFGDRSPSEVQAYDATILERYVDAVKAIFKDQELLGLDILSDGCFRYDEKGGLAEWWTNGVCRLGGLRRWTKKPEGEPAVKSVITPEYWKEVMSHYPASHASPSPPWAWPFWYTVEDEISPGKIEGLVEFYNSTKSFCNKPIKFSTPDAVLGGYLLIDRHYHDDREVLFALAKVFNRVLTELASNGCPIIQLDWPLAGLHHVANETKVKPEIWKEMIEIFNEEVKGVNAQIWIHFCFGRIGDALGLSCAETFKHLADCDADVIQIEAANTRGRFLKDEMANWDEHCSDKEIGLGAISPYNLNSEKPESAVGLITTALGFVEPDRLVITTDEGFRFISRARAEEKLKTLIQAVNIVRKSRTK